MQQSIRNWVNYDDKLNYTHPLSLLQSWITTTRYSHNYYLCKKCGFDDVVLGGEKPPVPLGAVIAKKSSIGRLSGSLILWVLQLLVHCKSSLLSFFTLSPPLFPSHQQPTMTRYYFYFLYKVCFGFNDHLFGINRSSSFSSSWSHTMCIAEKVTIHPPYEYYIVGRIVHFFSFRYIR